MHVVKLCIGGLALGVELIVTEHGGAEVLASIASLALAVLKISMRSSINLHFNFIML